MDADARFRRWFARAPILAALAGAVGCQTPAPVSPFTPSGMANTFSKYGAPLVRSQAPGAPAGPVEPTSLPALPATVAPPATPAPTADGTVSPVAAVSSNHAGLDDAATQVRVVAVIGSDVVITDDEVWQMVRQQAGEYVRLTGAERDAKEKEMFRKSLRMVIERELVIDDFMKKVKKNKPQMLDEIYENASSMAARNLQGFKKANNLKNDEELAKAFRSQGLSFKSIQRMFERNAIMEMYVGNIIREERNKVGLAQIEQYYKAHADDKDLKVDDRAKWQYLFVPYTRFATPDEARKYTDGLLARVKAGEDFAAVAEKYGGEVCKQMKGEGVGEKRGEINPPQLEPTVFQMAPGQTSGVIQTDTGLHVVKVVEREQAGVKPFDDKTQALIRQKLMAQAKEKAQAKLIEELWRKTTVKIVELP